MKLGFLGLGLMGEPIARNLVAAGHEVVVWNRTASRAEPLRALGATVAASPRQACDSGLVLTMLADDRAARDIVLGEDGVVRGLPKDGVHVSLSTIGVAMARELEAAHRAAGQQFVTAPVFGRPDAAAARRLVVVAAGPESAIARARPALEAIGRALTVIGDRPERASLVKLAGNLLIATVIGGLGETLALVRKGGIEGRTFIDVMQLLFQSPVYENYGKAIVEQRTRQVLFPAPLGLKDLRLAQDAARELAVPHPLASLLENALLTAIATGGDDQDWTALARVFAENAGLE